MNELTGGSNASKIEDPAPEKSEGSPRRRRFSTETANDLLFWGIHLMVVAISLGIMWVKIDSLTRVMRDLLAAQNRELAVSQAQALKAEEATERARQAENTRSLQLVAGIKVMDSVVSRVNAIQADIKTTLAKTNEINQLVLSQSEATKAAALQSQQAAVTAAGAAKNAAGAAGGAASAASRAAATSSRTGTVVAAKVVTTSDKRQLEAQQRALAKKQAQLSRTIKQVKKTGPNILQQIFH